MISGTNVLAIDPGGTTGIAVCIGGEIATCTSTDPEEVWGMCQRFDVIVIERFATSGMMSKYGLWTIEIVGGVRAIAYLHDKQLFIHSPQERYAYQQIAHKMLLDRKVPFVIHEEDALAHYLAYQERGH
jgi:hypothetical protein